MKQNMLLEEKKDYLLVLSAILAPMTGLRIGKVGPGEILCLLFCLVNFHPSRSIPKKDIFIRFWIGFLFTICLGTVRGVLKYPDETVTQDLITWFYLGIICIGTHFIIEKRSSEEIVKLLKFISCGSAFWYFSLYQYSRRVSSTFLGAPLWYAGIRFSGGATNPHQVALLLCLGLVVFTWLILNCDHFLHKIVYGVFFAITFFLLRQTRSSTAIMAVSMGIASVIWQNLWVKYRAKKQLFLLAFFSVFFLVLFFGFRFYHLFIQWIKSDSNGLDRILIFASFPTAFRKGPAFGLGPGIHAIGGLMEFHNTYLEIIAMGGIVGAIIFIVFSTDLFKSALRNPVSFGTLLAAYAYGLAGFGARRLVYWIIIVLAYELSRRSNSIARDV